MPYTPPKLHRLNTNSRNRRRIRLIRWTTPEIIHLTILLLLTILAIGAGGWLGMHYPD